MNNIAVADHPGRANWFHWLMQVLPQIQSLAEKGYTQIAVSPETESQWDSAKRMGKECGVEIIRTGSVEWFPAKGERISTATVRLLRDAFLDYSYGIPAGWNLFISRDGRKSRDILNEQELRNTLKDFKFILPEKRSVTGQARLFNDADMIVGVHGSALANVVFCRPDATVFEIRGAHQQEQGWVKQLCDAVGCQHIALGVQNYSESDLIEYINPDLLEKAIRSKTSDVIGYM